MTSVNWSDDEGLFALARRELFTAVVGDIMDKLGFLHQFLPPRIQPLRSDMVVIGRAMTVLEADVFEEGSSSENNSVMARAFGLMFEALDDLKPNEVYVCAGASPRYALWGRVDEHAGNQAGGGWRCGRRLLARHARHPGAELPRVLLRLIRPGSGSARQGD